MIERDNPNNGNRYDSSAAVVIPDFQSDKHNAHIKAFQAHQWQQTRKGWERSEAFAALAKRA